MGYSDSHFQSSSCFNTDAILSSWATNECVSYDMALTVQTVTSQSFSNVQCVPRYESFTAAVDMRRLKAAAGDSVFPADWNRVPWNTINARSNLLNGGFCTRAVWCMLSNCQPRGSRCFKTCTTVTSEQHSSQLPRNIQHQLDSCRGTKDVHLEAPHYDDSLIGSSLGSGISEILYLRTLGNTRRLEARGSTGSRASSWTGRN